MPQISAPPSEFQRPTWEQRDKCIQNAGWKGCIELDQSRQSDAFKACRLVEDQVAEQMGDQTTSDACHEMNMAMDYGSYEDKLNDAYYKCIEEAAQIAAKHEFYYENEFKPLFETCGIVQKQTSIQVLQATSPPKHQRPTLAQRDECIRSHTWTSCLSLDNTRESASYKACKKVEDKVDENLQHGLTEACQKWNVALDYGSQQMQLPDAYYDCMGQLAKVAETNDYYNVHEFQPMYVTCGTLSSSQSITTFV